MTAAADTGYAPRPGTVAHRVLALLEEEAPREFSVAMICERLPGIELHAVKPFGQQPANETHDETRALVAYLDSISLEAAT